MKYFIDTEFLEGTQKKTFLGINTGNTKPTIDLISIGIVAEDGREYYAISKDFNLKEAWNRFQIEKDKNFMNYGDGTIKVYWIRENVLKPIFLELCDKENNISASSNVTVNGGRYSGIIFTYRNLKRLINKYGKSNGWISNEIIQFVMDPKDELYNSWLGSIGEYFRVITEQNFVKPEFYAYYADYDWVAFCWLFGKMMDLPDGFPMYCKDLKQIFDEKEEKGKESSLIKIRANRLMFNWFDCGLKYHPDYPKQDPSKAHNAIEDARWNKQLYDFLSNL